MLTKILIIASTSDTISFTIVMITATTTATTESTAPITIRNAPSVVERTDGFPRLSSRSRQNPPKCLVKLNFSDEARKLARLLISRAGLFFISVQKMDGKKELG
jgi:hypothetical protein